jgi:hypothetical protein
MYGTDLETAGAWHGWPEGASLARLDNTPVQHATEKRYVSVLRRGSDNFKPLLQVYSDHHIFHQQDACGDTP